MLVDAGADKNARDPDRVDAGHHRPLNGHYDVAAMLVERGRGPESRRHRRDGGALRGRRHGHARARLRPAEPQVDKHGLRARVDEALLAHGANANAQLRTATVQRAHTPGERLLGAGATPLMRAAKTGDAAAMRILLDTAPIRR